MVHRRPNRRSWCTVEASLNTNYQPIPRPPRFLVLALLSAGFVYLQNKTKIAIVLCQKKQSKPILWRFEWLNQRSIGISWTLYSLLTTGNLCGPIYLSLDGGNIYKEASNIRKCELYLQLHTLVISKRGSLFKCSRCAATCTFCCLQLRLQGVASIAADSRFSLLNNPLYSDIIIVFICLQT